jgi:hypothetical protein
MNIRFVLGVSNILFSNENPKKNHYIYEQKFE